MSDTHSRYRGSPALLLHRATFHELTFEDCNCRKLPSGCRAGRPGPAPRGGTGLPCHLRQKKLPQALAALKAAHELAPKDARIAQAYALTLRSLGRPEEAATVLRRTAP
ncbi:tetratricopeptide repeat protein [Pelomonas sp. PFR6]|uniref:Tetratricopeptide repeat protein n=2 Tax=Roseateles violae TaxID=3058042 RepID=A0ABT8DTJ3_9BURK|nr:tetratricopeptide repeat protein [Pelomonas sp. PFR6]MDN3920340.1 tetratricopeptide repeat protein [Pelomonas sp. PFR6]